MSSHLSSGRLNLGLLREAYRKELLECLDKCSGTKALVWDDGLTSPLGLIAEYTLLREHEVEKMFQLSPTMNLQASVASVVFVVRPIISLMETLAKAVKKLDEGGKRNPFRPDFHILFVPRKTILCEQSLKDAGISGSFASIQDFGLDLIPIDTDLLSMEINCFKDLYIHNDYSTLFGAAKGLMMLQALYGVIPNISGKGACAKALADMLLRMRREVGGEDTHSAPQIDNLLLLDRNVDLITPLLTPLTYEALIDEAYKISYTSVELPGEKFNAQQQGTGSSLEPPPETKKLVLNSGDELFSELSGRNFNAIPPYLSKQTKLMSSQYEERHSAKTVADMKQFVSKLPKMQAMKQSLSTHTSVAELIKEFTSSEEFRENLSAQQEFVHGIDTDRVHPYILDCMMREEPIEKVLRLMCLQCLCNSGFKPKVLEEYKREIIQSYGFVQLPSLFQLESAGLLFAQQGARTYPTLRKTLELVQEDVNEVNPNNVSYVFSGFAPLSVRLAQFAAQPGWRAINDLLGLLPGPRLQHEQHSPAARKRRGSITSMSSSTSVVERKTTLVFFLGGVTYAEIAALRFLNQHGDSAVEYVIGTTSFLRGSSLIADLLEKLEPQVLF